MKNRKLFAIITLVAFMLTMMPMMAFATTGSGSSISVEDGSAKVGGELEFILDFDAALADKAAAGKALKEIEDKLDGYVADKTAEIGSLTFGDDYVIKEAGDTTSAGESGKIYYFGRVLAVAEGQEETEATVEAVAKFNEIQAKMDALEEEWRSLGALSDGDKTQLVVVFAERNGSLSEVDYIRNAGRDYKRDEAGYLVFDANNPVVKGEQSIFVTSEEAGTVTMKAYVITGTIGVEGLDNIAKLYNGSGDFIKTGFVGNGVTGKFTTTDNEITATGTVTAYVDDEEVMDGNVQYAGSFVEFNADADDITTDATGIDTVKDEGELGTETIQSVKANNGVDYLKVSMQFFKGTAQNTKLVGEDVDIYVNKIGATVSKDTVTTSATGRIDFKVSATKPGTYIVTVDCGSFTHEIKVEFDGTDAATPEFVFITDKTIAVDEETSRVAELALYDGLGNEVDFDLDKITVEIVKAPEDSALEDEEIGIGGNSGIRFNADGELTFVPDAVGTYEIKAYNNVTGVAAYATIKADEFGVVDHATISYPYASYASGATTPAPTVRLVDKAGVIKDANKGACDYSYAGTGVVKFDNGQVTFSDEKDYAGKEVTVSVVVNGRYAASTTLTIGVKAAAINFTDASGQAAKEIKVTGQLVDLNGNNVALSSTDVIDVQSAVVISRPEGAIVSVDTDDFNYKNEFRNKGIANIVVTSNMEGTVQANLVVKVTTDDFDNDGERDVYYVAGVATVNVGETTADVEEANDIVTFIIGSSTFIANNKATTSDVAPYIVDGRTFIPVRAFVEATGATIEYDAATQVVTIKGDGVDAQMTIGSNILTVNGETVVMDTAAAIKDGRTVLPVRYAGQAIGYNFECAYGANGAVTAVTMFK